jgi:hypothetical protein
MEKRARIGTDPLSWIKDSKDESASDVHGTQGIQSIHSADDPRGKRRRVITKTSQRGLPEGWERATLIVQEAHLEKIKALAYWERKKIKDVIAEAFSAYLDDKDVEPIRKMTDDDARG